jgi:hypothetical protein
MGNVKHTRYQRRAIPAWKVLKDNQRQLPCHPATPVRVKVLEPGIQSRWCDRCGTYRYFMLEAMNDDRFPSTLRLRWLSVEEAERYVNSQTEVLDLQDIL